MTENEHFGNTILLQIGGVNKLKSSVGAYNFIMLNKGVSFRLKNPRANYIKVVLSNMDLYDVEIGIVDSTSYKIVKIGYGIYNDALKEFIEQNIGMFLTPLEKAVEGKSIDNYKYREITFSKKNNKNITIALKTYQDGRIAQIDNPQNFNFPYKIGQVLNMGHTTWACNNGYLVNNKDVCQEKNIFGIKISDIPKGHELRHIYPHKFT